MCAAAREVMRASIRLFAVMVASSCVHLEAPGLTSEEHRKQAGRLVEKAQADARFDSYELDEQQTRQADRELIEASAHLTAAKSLESFEESACVGLSKGERSSCPLFASSVRRVEWAQDGFRLTFKQARDASRTLPRLRCHLAYAVATGFDRPSCPLFIPGTSLRQESDDGITFAGDSAAVASALRVQARKIFTTWQVTQHAVP